MKALSPMVDTTQLSLQNAHYFFRQHANAVLSLDILFKFLTLYFYFSFLALHLDIMQNLKLTGGQMRGKGKPSLLWCAHCSHTGSKKQLVILQLTLPNRFAARGTWLSRLVAQV